MVESCPEAVEWIGSGSGRQVRLAAEWPAGRFGSTDAQQPEVDLLGVQQSAKEAQETETDVQDRE